LDAIARLDLQSTHKIFCENVRMILLNTQNPQGSWGNNQGSSLSGNIETTAYSIMALIHAFPKDDECLKAAKKGIDWILDQRSTGWTTTRDTLYASWAIGEAGQFLFKPRATEIIVSLNDEVYRTFHYDPETDPIKALDTLYQMRAIYLDKFKKPSTNKLSVTSSSLETNVSFEVKKYYDKEQIKTKTNPPPPPPTKLLNTVIESVWSSRSYKVGQSTIVTVNIKPKEQLNALMVEIPVPAGFSYDLSSIRSETKWRYEFNPNLKQIACFVSSLSKKSTITVPLNAKLPGIVMANPCRAFEMYRPDGVAFSAVHNITINS